MRIFTGCACALVTPFDAEGRLDAAALARLVRWHIGRGTDALVVCGTTGEASTMTEREQAEAAANAVEAADGRVPVIAGVGGNDTRRVIAACKAARAAGADGALAVTPYYNKTTQEGLIAHYTAVAEASEIPLILYRKEYSHYLSLKRELKRLTELAEQSRQEEDYVRFQLEQLIDAALQPGEQEALEQEQDTLSHAEEIKSNLYKINQLLDGEEMGVLPLLKSAQSVADTLERYYPDGKEMVERIHAAYVDLNDLQSEVDAKAEDIEFNPGRLEWVQERLNTLYTLEQKHHVSTVEALLELQENYERQLAEIGSYDEQMAELNKQIAVSHEELMQQAAVLSTQRQIAAQRIEKELVEMVQPLGMPNMRFQIHFVQREEPAMDGLDEIEFMFAANKRAELQPVAETASGGEISRLMLCIKAMIAGFTALPTIIFDEVDTGVSGDIADKMGDIMQNLGTNMQVLTITHLPQIAAKGAAHYYVYKEDLADRTATRIRRLTPEERVSEVGRMLSGATLTEASLANAKDLLSKWL